MKINSVISDMYKFVLADGNFKVKQDKRTICLYAGPIMFVWQDKEWTKYMFGMWE